jgi:broad specificity phosphatase PhoE
MTTLESISLRISATIRSRIETELSEIVSLNDEDAAELMLVRHAEPAGCYQPLDEFDRGARLSRRGVDQARRLARRLESLWVERIYFAPEQATEETATILQDILRCPAACIPDLRDIGFGLRLEDDGSALCDGASAAESFIARPRWDALPGFEGSRAFRLRVVLALESLLSKHPGRRIVVVTHSSLINAYLSMVLDIPRDVFFNPEPSSVSIVRSHNDLYAVRAVNDTAHLLDC